MIGVVQGRSSGRAETTRRRTGFLTRQADVPNQTRKYCGCTRIEKRAYPTALMAQSYGIRLGGGYRFPARNLSISDILPEWRKMRRGHRLAGGGRLVALDCRRRIPEPFMKGGGEIGCAPESDPECNFGNCTRILFEQLVRPLKADEPDELRRGQVREIQQLAAQLPLAKTCLPGEILHAEILVCNPPLNQPQDLLQEGLVK